MKASFLPSLDGAVLRRSLWGFPWLSLAAFLVLSPVLREVLWGPTTLTIQDTERRRGAVASEDNLCTEIGIKILADGGNAADALIGTTLCVGVTGKNLLTMI